MILIVEKSWSKMQPCLWAQTCRYGRSHTLLEHFRDGIGYLPGQGCRDPRIFLQILCAFLRDSGMLIFKSTKTPKKNLRKICATIRSRICAKKSAHLRTENLRKKVHKVCAPKFCAPKTLLCAPKVGLNFPSLWMMEARKNEKKSAPNLRETQPHGVWP